MPGLDVLKQYLQQIDEVQLLELLDLSTEDLINAFEDRILERREYLEMEMELTVIPDDDEDYDTDTTD